MMNNVTKIPANRTINKSNLQGDTVTKKRVAAYARVSTDEDEQLNSYNAQVDYYTKFIKDHTGWTFAGMYADEGISGTQTKHRVQFKKMIEDALAGKIDLILTKSVSRFARNTVDTLNAIRELKDKGVEVYFEKENIYTLDAKGEVLLTIMGSLAQEESRSISENTLWGVRKKMEAGKFTLPYKNFLGYDRGEGDKLVVNKEQAETVKQIYRLFLYGYSAKMIAKILMDRGLKTATGNSRWDKQAIERILTNEKYKGDACLQKTYTSNYLTKEIKKNQGELPKYYIKNDHEAIIEPDTFDLVQIEFKKRKENPLMRRSNGGKFNNKVYCGVNGGTMFHQHAHVKTKYETSYFVCKECKVSINTKDLEQYFIEAMNKTIINKKVQIKNAEIALNYMQIKPKMIKDQEKLLSDIDDLNIKLENMIKLNATKSQSQKAYKKEYGEVALAIEEKQKQLNELNKVIDHKKAAIIKIKTYIQEIKNTGGKTKDFDNVMFMSFVDRVFVYQDKVTFEWKNGDKTEIKR